MFLTLHRWTLHNPPFYPPPPIQYTSPGMLDRSIEKACFAHLVKSRYPEMMTRKNGLSPDEIANLLREFSENELEGRELSYSNSDSNQDIRLSENDCEESAKVQM
ncbi:hypothetical protein TNCV_1325611 [Trichonephila clavipes]|nr:hypothetical protein TNCV_1325611 [Trichonephila clavipes]